MSKPIPELPERLRWVWKPLATGLILGLLVMVGVTYRSTGSETWVRLRQFHPLFAVAAFGLIFTAWTCNGLRLKILAANVGYRLPLRRTIQVSLVSEFGVAATPAGSGSLVLRVFLMRRLGGPAGITLSLLASDGIFDLSFFLFVFPFALWPLLSGKIAAPGGLGQSIVISLLVIALLIALGLAFMKSNRRLDRLSNARLVDLPQWRRRFRALRRMWRHRIAHARKEFWEGLRSVARIPKSILGKVLLIAIVQWSCRYGVLPLLLWGFGYPVNPFLFFVLQGTLFMLQLVMVIPGGSGGIEVAFALMMGHFMPPELVGVALVLWRFYTYHLYVIGGGLAFATAPYTFGKGGR
jgi:uncharacterized protein (TIRG00374 family)